MSEYIIKAADWAIDYKGESLFKGCDEIVRCRDCKHFTYADAAHMGNDWCAKHDHIGWSVNGFCAWGEKASNFTTCKCGEDIELGNRESAVCPSCGRTVIE